MRKERVELQRATIIALRVDVADLRSTCAMLRAQAEAAREGLNVIAAWSEGSEVSGSFDEPCSAQYARDTLAAMDGAKPK